MKRLFIFSYLVLVFLFFTSIIFVFQLDFFSSDEWESDYLDRTNMSLSQLLSEISAAKGVASAEASLEQVLGNVHKQLRVISLDSAELSAEEKQILRDNRHYVKDMEEDISYIMFQGSDKVYAISRDESAPFWQEYYFKESVASGCCFPCWLLSTLYYSTCWPGVCAAWKGFTVPLPMEISKYGPRQVFGTRWDT